MMIEISQNEVAVQTACALVLRCELPLRFADMDADGRVNNTEYYRDTAAACAAGCGA